MLHELRIENLLLIERAELRLERGPQRRSPARPARARRCSPTRSTCCWAGARGRRSCGPGADEAYVEGVFEPPPGLLDDPELAELAARLPDGADEIVLGRRVSASGRTSAFIGGRSASAADLRLLGGRGCSPSTASTSTASSRSARPSSRSSTASPGPRTSSRRAEYRDAHAEVGRLERELDELREREGARERDLDLLPLRARRDRGGGADGRRGGRRAPRRRASAFATPSGCAPPRPARWRRSPATASMTRRSRAAAASSRWRGAELGAVGGHRPRARRAGRAAAARSRSSSTTSPAPCARLLDADRRRAGPPRGRWRSASPRSTGWSESTAARSRRCSSHAERLRAEIERLENAEERGRRARRRGSTPRPARGPSSPPSSATTRREGGRAARQAGARPSSPSWRWRARASRRGWSPTPDGFGAARRRDGRAPARDQPRAAGLAAARRGLGRRALADHARAQHGRRAGAPTRAAYASSSTRSTPGIGGHTARAVGERLRGARRRAPGDLHHPPAAGRVARRDATSGSPRTHGGGAGARHRRAGERRRAGRRDRAACSAPTRGDEAASRHARELLGRCGLGQPGRGKPA